MIPLCIDRVHGLQVFGEMGNTFVTWHECPNFVENEEGYHAVEGVFGYVARRELVMFASDNANISDLSRGYSISR